MGIPRPDEPDDQALGRFRGGLTTKTSRVAEGQLRGSGRECDGLDKGPFGVVDRAALQALVETVEELVEQVPQDCGVPLALPAPAVVVVTGLV